MKPLTALTCFGLLLAVACGGDPPPCKLDGSYRVIARERSGDCGPIPDEVDSTATTELPGCMQHAYPPSGDVECSVNYSRSCVARDASSIVIGVSVARDDDDETWSGAADVTVRDASDRIVCHSLYALTFVAD